MPFNFGCSRKINDSYAEFFGGVRCGSKFFLTRLSPFPDSGEQYAIHETDHARLENITVGSGESAVEYKCVFVSGSQPGVGGALQDMPDAHAYMWFQTNWVPVNDPDAVPIAGLARVKLQNIGENEYTTDAENNEFTLTHSWLVNDSAGNPHHWNSKDRLCHYYSNDSVANGGARRKTCTGPSHFAYFEKMQPTQTQHRLTYWNLGVANAVVSTWNNPEVTSSDHDWLAAEFDQYHFPIALWLARRSDRSPPDPFVGPPLSIPDFTGDEYGSIATYVKAGIATLPSVAIDSGDNIGRISHQNGLQSIFLNGHSSGLGDHGFILSHFAAYDKSADDDPADWEGVTFANARTYIKDFAVALSGAVDDPDTSNPVVEQNSGNKYADDFFATQTIRNFGLNFAFVSVGRAVSSGQGGSVVTHGNGSSWGNIGGSLDHPSDPTGEKILEDYVASVSTTVAEVPRGSSNPSEFTNWLPAHDDSINDKWVIGGNGSFSRVFGSIYPSSAEPMLWGWGGSSVNPTTGNTSQPGRLMNLDNGLFAESRIPQSGGTIAVLPELLVVEVVLMNSWGLGESDDGDLGFTPNGNSTTYSDGRIVCQGARWPLESTDYQNASYPYSLVTDSYVAGAEDWNNNFPFYTPLSVGTEDDYRVTDCVYFRAQADSDQLDDPVASRRPVVWNEAGDYNISSHLDDTGDPYAPRAKWRDSSGIMHQNGILSGGGPLIDGTTR